MSALLRDDRCDFLASDFDGAGSDPYRFPAAAITVSSLSFDVDAAKVRHRAEHVVNTVRDITRSLGAPSLGRAS
ncbi:MAG: hypothetical protein WCF24_06085 [Acidimicrobiales bacterium]